MERWAQKRAHACIHPDSCAARFAAALNCGCRLPCGTQKGVAAPLPPRCGGNGCTATLRACFPLTRLLPLSTTSCRYTPAATPSSNTQQQHPAATPSSNTQQHSPPCKRATVLRVRRAALA
eukprot:354524-Chlamydomonas_euryale.AAC.1